MDNPELRRKSFIVQNRDARERKGREQMGSMPDNGMVHVKSAHSVEESVARIEAALNANGVTIFARVNHSGEAEKAGLKMRPTKLIIFGSPKGGTPLMVASPTLAIDLPLKALVWEDGDGAVWLSYNSPEYLRGRHHFPEELVKNIAAPGMLLQKAVA